MLLFSNDQIDELPTLVPEIYRSLKLYLRKSLFTEKNNHSLEWILKQ